MQSLLEFFIDCLGSSSLGATVQPLHESEGQKSTAMQPTINLLGGHASCKWEVAEIVVLVL